MSMTKSHTPAPWRVCGGYAANYIAIHSEAGYIVFGMADYATHKESSGNAIAAPDYGTQRANARLIAAAPELLQALIDFYTLHAHSNWTVPDDQYHVVMNAATAIAKATGDRS